MGTPTPSAEISRSGVALWLRTPTCIDHFVAVAVGDQIRGLSRVKVGDAVLQPTTGDLGTKIGQRRCEDGVVRVVHRDTSAAGDQFQQVRALTGVHGRYHTPGQCGAAQVQHGGVDLGKRAGICARLSTINVSPEMYSRWVMRPCSALNSSRLPITGGSNRSNAPGGVAGR